MTAMAKLFALGAAIPGAPVLSAGGDDKTFGCGHIGLLCRGYIAQGCHLYFAHRVTFQSCADIACRRRMKMSPACQLLQMTLPPGISGVFRGDGSDCWSP